MQQRRARWAIIASMLLGLAGLSPLPTAAQPTAEEILGDMHWPPAEKAKILAGEFVNSSIENVSARDLSVAIGFQVRVSPAELAKQVVAGLTIHADAQVAAHGQIRGNGSARDFQGMTLSDAAADAFLQATPGSDLNLSSDEIAAFRASSAQADPRTAALAQLQKILLTRHATYRTSGLDGIAPYDRGHETRSGGEDLRKASASMTVVKRRFAAFYEMMNGYPGATVPGMHERFSWIQYGTGIKANYVVEQLVTANVDEVHAVLQRQIYASQGYNVEQAVAGLFPVDEGTLVVYVNHTSTDQVAGFGGSAKRSIGTKMMVSQLEKMFEGARKIAEQ